MDNDYFLCDDARSRGLALVMAKSRTGLAILNVFDLMNEYVGVHLNQSVRRFIIFLLKILPLFGLCCLSEKYLSNTSIRAE